MDKKKKIIIISIILIVFAFGIWLFFGNRNEEENLIIKENVYVISSGTDIVYQPINVEENTITFAANPNYKEGDIIVAGIIDVAPNGFIRKVVGVREENNEYIYETEYAVLTDVFEEAHIIRCFVLTDKGVYEPDDMQLNNKLINNLNDEVYDIQTLSYNTDSTASAVLLENISRELLFSVEFEEELSDNISVAGNVGFDAWIEIKIDIEDEEIDFGIVSHIVKSGEVFLGYLESDEKEYSKNIFVKKLPNFQFAIGYVPIVITNDFAVVIDAGAEIEGAIGTTMEIDSESISGFEYSSRTGQKTEINESEYLADGMLWNTEGKASGSVSGGISAHLITKLYGSTGADIKVGLEAGILGEISKGINMMGEVKDYGCLEMSISPVAQGSVVVSVPVIDEKLAASPLFDVTMNPLWEKKWEYQMEDTINQSGEQEQENQEKDRVYLVNIPYTAAFMKPFVESGDNYITEGVLFAYDYVLADVLKKIQIGDIYTLYGNEMKYIGLVPYGDIFSGIGKFLEEFSVDDEEAQQFHLFSDENGRTYFTRAEPAKPDVSMENIVAYRMFMLKEGSGWSSSLTTISENYTFIIKKDAIVEMCVAQENGELITEVYTFEECIKNDFLNYKGESIEEQLSRVIPIFFNKEGNVTMIRAYLEEGDLKSFKNRFTH